MSQDCAEARNTHFNLVQFPTEMIAHILSFHELAKPILRLCMTGSRVLQHKVLLSASNMHLESHMELDFAKLPSLIAQMTSLRSLTIDRDYNELLDENHTLEVLKSVAPTLQKLVLWIDSSSKLFELRDLSGPTDTSEDPLLDPDEPSNYLATRFQRLQWLEFDTESYFHGSTPYRLPPTLTHLEFRFEADKISNFTTLPPSLTHLIVHSTRRLPESFFDALPSGLECLDLSNSLSGQTLSIEQVQALPRSLKKIVMDHGCHWNPTTEMIKALPPQLDSLINVSIYPYDILPEISGRLKQFSTGGAFKQSLAPSQVRGFSRNMDLLKFKLKNQHELTSGDFPPSLTHLELELTGENIFEHLGSFLPSKHLHTLCLTARLMSVKVINTFPPTLTKLSIALFGHLDDTETIHLPPSLEVLELQSGDREEHWSFAPMPHSLTTFKLIRHRINFSTLFALPPLLRKLNFGTISDMATFDPMKPENVERIIYLRKMAQEAGFDFDETLPTRTPRKYGVYDLLPRTLTQLVMTTRTGETLPTGHWQSLPKNLSHLELQGAADDLDYLPFESITENLSVAKANWKDKHVKRLNPRLLHLPFMYDARWDVTPECVPWIPRNIEFGRAVGSEFDELTLRRSEALKNLDREAFHALNSKS